MNNILQSAALIGKIIDVKNNKIKKGKKRPKHSNRIMFYRVTSNEHHYEHII